MCRLFNHLISVTGKHGTVQQCFHGNAVHPSITKAPCKDLSSDTRSPFPSRLPLISDRLHLQVTVFLCIPPHVQNPLLARPCSQIQDQSAILTSAIEPASQSPSPPTPSQGSFPLFYASNDTFSAGKLASAADDGCDDDDRASTSIASF